ncbi:Translation initiation factor eIF3 subunit, putative [Trypanosoma equiperdum]|uniref:Uncharacterized protein n=4 Tax=Trypanozoon TaxID=39700 RepID=Q582T5_TRYB2|nr:hypothetical protein, conserved [Trypanosoma brucei gambiense DAL972]XP_843816.1 hypothetical protein, conserved [Trypanosoma brucei brucei TREU927]AAX80697.1 hypothetical protein, conserved [Trypanosoma brucei]RHW73827.1 Translation initiation factor eIF3 subunit [Trypanosoma brucei equiperdum]SCU70650.1 Translation initiation factor eIF3 subunit, putative [Trypanosoma equiperdum]AAZ10257.1 hypothetical protein, conserved [Trypanosoma brucei brucei TREU927]CBH09881.1 hypothetical protein,|eukprot:XP_011772174.1 hypothetical protein, conserved [Trypanosoma brucei gambiense DAL972]
MEEDYHEYDDAADDWEVEAQQGEAAEEEALKRKLREQQALLEKERQRRRARASARTEEEELLPADVARALEDMKSTASSAGEALNVVKDSENAVKLIADMPVNTAAEAEALGVVLADRLLSFSESPHFNSILSVVFRDIAREFKSGNALDTLRTIKDKVSNASKVCEGKMKQTKGDKREQPGKEGASAKGGSSAGDALGLDTIGDEGGAANVPDGDDNFM